MGGDFSGQLQPRLLDRSGQLVRVISGDVTEYEPRFSPDGRRLALRGNDANGEQVWIVDLERDVHTRLTFDEGFQGQPVWSPDGESIAYGSTTGRNWRTLIRRADGGDEPRVLTMEVPLTLTESKVQLGSARKLFDIYTSLDIEIKAADLSPDGK